ncbi:MAG TPA: site-2 protease family protein [Verrucomicrobiae bacterium]|nr:site-2 protease family protein [Verrucomicrobiae bacterium]
MHRMGDVARIGDFGIWYIVFLFTLTLHEAGHALVAWIGGDDTAYRGGQVTLNPWPHIRREPFGTIFVPILTFVTSGWMMGWASAPYDPEWGRKHPKRLAAMSAAGPCANLLLASVVFFILKVLLGAGVFTAPERVGFDHLVIPAAGTDPGSWLNPLAMSLSVALNLNVLLFLFNLIPLPPLDGSGVLSGLLPGSVGKGLDGVARNPMMSLIGLMLAWRLFDYVYPPAFSLLLVLLHPDLSYG